MIQIDGVTKSYGNNIVLSNFNAQIDIGTTCIMGQSGSGKTTLVNLVLGLIGPDSGTISLPSDVRYSCVFQEDRLLSSMTVLKNILLVYSCDTQLNQNCPIYNTTQSAARHQVLSQAKYILDQLGLQSVHDSKVATLSGGMKRRVAIARALLIDADIYVFDEPFDGLDIDTRDRVAQIVKDYTQGKVCLLITHNEHDATVLSANILTIPKIN
ncbi:MAG: ATP-binding cassette domain-containing protein [Clostridiales bacterium]|jgi:NitT/TauT family transport system ATP-binding protein|nr:ATP-binding cassette domain-containing protein [Clostridiales bacterium]